MYRLTPASGAGLSAATADSVGQHLAQTTSAPALRRAVVATSIGNCVEWFDFAVYGYLATTLAVVFFPSTDATASLLSTFAVFAVAFFVRPIGGLFFGSLGDRIGRQRTLAAAILLMSASTFAIGVLPGYSVIGILAPLLLVLARCAQGFSIGGEFGGASSFLAEYAPPGRRGFFTSWTQFSALTGFVLGSGLVTWLTYTLAKEDLLAWGWRIPFLLAGPLGFAGLYLRFRLEDTPVFKALRRTGRVASSPLWEALTQNYRPILLAAGLAILPNVGFYTILNYMPIYLSRELGFPATTSFASTTLTLLVVMALIPLLGALSDRIGRKPLLFVSCFGFALFTYPAFVLMAQGSLLFATLAQVGLGVIQAAFMSTSVAALTELFVTRVRYSGFSIGYNVSVALFGGTAPFLATYLIAVTGDTLSPAFYVVAAAIATCCTVVLLRETAARPLDESGA
jgi:MFS transporter, MHS family, proline/betaine transporter